MKPIYKKVKVTKEHCPVCLEQLSGNNSIANPWTCSCGNWKYDDGEYEIIKNIKT